MIIKKLFLIFILPFIFLCGCSNEKKKTTFKTVEYYVKNKKIRDARKKECMLMKDITETISKDCANVDIAINRTTEGGTLDTTGIFK